MTAIFDIGKTNKKFFIFDEAYQIVYQKIESFDGTDLHMIRAFIFHSLEEAPFGIRAINFSAYGASLVYIDEMGNPLTPLYDYNEKYPEWLQKKFYTDYGGEVNFSLATASPVLGSLNSGMQVYLLKYEQPAIFEKIKYALHLPQWLSYLVTGVACSDMTSIGCHTMLWDFQKSEYHAWTAEEKIRDLLAPIYPSGTVFTKNNISCGIGLHDSSAALIPYLAASDEPFVLLSTGTWNISLNPFNHAPLTAQELRQDCLCYLNYRGRPVKASRLWTGYQHDAHDQDYLQNIVARQIDSTKLVMQDNIKKIYVDGGFANNNLFMELLAGAFPDQELRAAAVPQASALGAAMALLIC